MLMKKEIRLLTKTIRQATGLPLPAAKLAAKQALRGFDFLSLADGLGRLLGAENVGFGLRFHLECRFVGTCGEGTCQHYDYFLHGPKGSYRMTV
jgi:hypothetical protein